MSPKPLSAEQLNSTIPHTYIPSFNMSQERAFDRLIAQGQTKNAADLITGFVDQSVSRLDKGYLQGNLPRIMLKELALPLYERQRLDHLGFLVDNPSTVAQVYPRIVTLMEYFQNLHDNIGRGTNPYYDKRMTNTLTGGISELAIMALTTRQITGSEDDEFNLIPSTADEDQETGGKIPSVYTNIDFWLSDRESGRQLPIQVKTTATPKRYHPDITIINFTSIAGGNKGDAHRLQQALIAETTEGSLSDEQTQHIEESSDKLFDKFRAGISAIALQQTIL